MEHLNELHAGMVSRETLERNKAQYREEIEKHDRQAYQKYLTRTGKLEVGSHFRQADQRPVVLILNDGAGGLEEAAAEHDR